MTTRSKRYKNSSKPNFEELELPKAIETLSSFDKVKFDETVEISMSLGVDPKQTSQAVRGVVNLPHGSGKEIKVLVFTESPEEAIQMGADFAGLEDLISKIKEGWMDFDVGAFYHFRNEDSSFHC